MGRYSFLRNTNDPQGLSKEVERYRTLLEINGDPAVTRVLQGLLAEAEARLAMLRPSATADADLTSASEGSRRSR